MANSTVNKKTVRLAVIIGIVLAFAVGLVALTLILVDHFSITPPPPRTVYTHEDWEYIVKEDGTLEIVAYNGLDTEVEVPSIIAGREVTSLGDYVFHESAVIELYIGSFVKSVGKYCFSSAGSLTKLELSPELEVVGDYAFRLCESLEEIDLPNTVHTIGAGAFYGTSVTSIDLPSGITEIPADAFAYCSSLVDLVIPVTVKSVGEYAFYDCGAVATLTMAGVESVGTGAFKNCTSLETITLGNKLSLVSPDAFAYCSSLKSITVPSDCAAFEVASGTLIDKVNKLAIIHPPRSEATVITVPDYVQHIAPNAFGDNKTVVEIVLPSGLVTIGERAFNSSSLLTRLVNSASPAGATFDMPKTVTDIGGYAFSGCHFYNQLDDEFTVVGDGILIKYTPVTDIAGGWVDTAHATVIRKTSVESGIVVEGAPQGVSLRVPDGIKKISSAFANLNALISITLPESVVELSAGAFSYAAFLESCDMSASSVTTIGDGAFEACQLLSDVRLPSTLKTLGDNVFFSCFALTEITIPPVERIGSYMFADCTALKTVNLSLGTKIIGNHAFYNNTKLAVITLPASLTHIEEYAFSRSGLVEFTLPATVSADGYILFNCVKLRNLTIRGEGVTPVGIALGATALGTVVIEGDFYRIGDESFYDCNLLKNVTVPRSVREIGSEAFAHCSSLKAIDFPGNLTYVGDYAFRHATRLETFAFDRTLTTLGDYAFAGCEKLNNIDLRWVTTLGKHVFENCFAIETVDIRSVAYEIPYGAFSSCTSLREIRISDTVTAIGTAAFLNTQKLTSFTMPASLISIGDNAFGASAVSTIVWNDKLETIGHNAFYRTALTELVFPDSLRRIGSAAFAECSALRTVDMGNGLSDIGEAAFMLSSSLYDVVFSEELTTLQDEVFAYTGLVSIDLPDKLKTIEMGAFNGCSELARVDFPRSVRTIEENAFGGCEALTVVWFYGDVDLIRGMTVSTGNEYFISALMKNFEDS